MSIPSSTDIYIPAYIGIKNEHRRLRRAIEYGRGDDRDMDLGVYTESDDYTVALIKAYCANWPPKPDLKLTFILRELREVDVGDCGEVKIVRAAELCSEDAEYKCTETFTVMPEDVEEYFGQESLIPW